MIGRNQKANARAALLIAWRNFGNHSFRVDLAGRHYRPLKDAESLGWCWFLEDRCSILPAGLREIEPYLGDVVYAADHPRKVNPA
jgi:hypothetical protein